MDVFAVGSHVRLDGRSYQIADTKSGGMGQVLFCIAAEESRSFLYTKRLAVKIFRPDADLRQIQNELKVWQTLNHPNIVALKIIGHVNDWLCAVMPWLPDGCTTHAGMFRREGLASVKEMLEQMCDALHYSAQKGILHLDIKPGNILSHGDHYVLADWGIAKFSAKRAIDEDPASGGTIPYMAPERFRAEPKNEIADIYSLGMTAFFLITDMLPFTESNARGMVHAIVTGHVEQRLNKLTEPLPSSWRKLILACCAYDEWHRPNNYRQLKTIIRDLET